MDFKSRFHGKTTVLTKQGPTSLFTEPGNPIIKYIPPPQGTEPNQNNAQFSKKPFAMTYDKPTSSVAAFRPKGHLKKSKYSNFFTFNGYIGPVQNPTPSNNNTEVEAEVVEEQLPFNKMSKSLLATLNKKAKEREALYQSVTSGSPAKQNHNFEKSHYQLTKSPGGEPRYLSPMEKRDFVRNLVAPSADRNHRNPRLQPIQNEQPQTFRNTYNNPQHTQRIILSRQKSVQSDRKVSMDSYIGFSEDSPVRKSFSHLPYSKTEQSPSPQRKPASRQKTIHSARKSSMDSQAGSSDYSPIVRKSFSHQTEPTQNTQRVTFSRQNQINKERKDSMDSPNAGSSELSPVRRSTFSNLSVHEMKSMAQKDLKLRVILSKDRDAYGIGARERYFKSFRRTRSDLGNESNFLSKSLNAEERIASRGEYQDYIYEANPLKRNNSFVQNGSSKGIGYREVVTDRFRLPTIEKEVLNKSRVFEQNSSFKSLSSRGPSRGPSRGQY